MSRTPKIIITTDHAGHQVVVTPASIQHVRTGGRRRAAPKVGTVPGVRSLLT